jgi:hypothetical protein
MTKILDELQARVAEAKKRLDDAMAALQVAQQACTQAQHNFNVWNMAAQVEFRDEQAKQAAAEAKQMPLPTVKTAPDAESSVINDVVDFVDAVPESSVSLNKTDMVRDLLRQHPAGMTATEIWAEVSGQFKYRPYLYSVLKRLKDRDEITKRRTGKYCLKLATKIEEVTQQQSVVH